MSSCKSAASEWGERRNASISDNPESLCCRCDRISQSATYPLDHIKVGRTLRVRHLDRQRLLAALRHVHTPAQQQPVKVLGPLRQHYPMHRRHHSCVAWVLLLLLPPLAIVRSRTLGCRRPSRTLHPAFLVPRLVLLVPRVDAAKSIAACRLRMLGFESVQLKPDTIDLDRDPCIRDRVQGMQLQYRAIIIGHEAGL